MTMSTHAVRKWGIGLVLGVALTWPGFASPARAQDSGASKQDLSTLQSMENAFRSIAKKVQPAVVQIRTTATRKAEPSARRRIDPKDIPEPWRQFFEEFGEKGFQMPSPQPQHASGSGVIIDAENGYVLTNNHVVASEEQDKEDASDEEKIRIDVTLADGRKIKGQVLGTDPKTDLALVQIKAENLTALPLGDSDKLQVGDIVLAIGAPFGLEQTITQGIVSALGRNVQIAQGYNDFIQTDAAINPGNSGGPLVNINGEVIGINTAIATSGVVAGYMGVGFSIPSNMAKDILPYLEKGEEVVRGYLGVKIRGSDLWEPGLAQSYGLTEEQGGVLIEDFTKIPGIPEMPAQKAGLKMDDIILSYNGKRVRTANELQALVAHAKPGEKVNLKVWRDRKEITIPVTIEQQPKEFFAEAGGRGGRGGRGGQEESKSEATIDALGITVEQLTTENAKRFGWENDSEAKGKLVVTDVDPVGEAAALGIARGDLIINVQGEAVNTVEALRNALSKEALAKGVRIRIRTTNPRVGYRTLFLQVNP